MATSPQQPEQTIDELAALRFGFDNLPLEQFRGMTAEQIEAHPGIGPKYRTRIQEALATLDRLRAGEVATPETEAAASDAEAATPETEAAASDPEPAAPEAVANGFAHEETARVPQPEPVEPVAAEPGAGPDPYLEPAAPGTSGPTVFLMAALLLAIIITVVVFASGRDRTRAMQDRLVEAEALAAASREALTGVEGGLARDAQMQVSRVYQKVRNRNLGEALEDLQDLESSLRSMAGAGTVIASPERTAQVQEALRQLQAARAALLLGQPRSQEQLEAAAAGLQLAVSGLQPQEVKE